MGFQRQRHSDKFELPMSALGQKQTSRHFQSMSALSPKADIAAAPPLKVSFGQIDNPKVERAEDLF